MSGISIQVAIRLISSSVFGGGVFMIVKCFGYGGYVLSSIIFTGVFLFSLLSAFYLVESAQFRKKEIRDKLERLNIEGEFDKELAQEYSEYKYGDILQVVHPIYGTKVASIFMIIGCYGATLVYFNLLVSLCEVIIGKTEKLEPLGVRACISLGLGAVLAVVLSFKDLKRLSYVSYFTVGCIIFTVLYLIVLSANFGTSLMVSSRSICILDRNIFNSISIMIFMFSCHQNIVGVIVSMANSTKNAQIKATFIGLTIPFVFYLLIGSLGYFHFGKIESSFLDVLVKTSGDYITKYKLESKFDPNAYFIYFSTVLSSLVLLFAIPIQSFEARRGVFEHIGSEKIEVRKYFILVTAIHLAVLIAIGISGVNPSLLMGFLGSIIEPAFIYFFPALAYYKIQQMKNKTSISAILMMAISVIIAGISLFFIFNDIIVSFEAAGGTIQPNQTTTSDYTR